MRVRSKPLFEPHCFRINFVKIKNLGEFFYEKYRKTLNLRESFAKFTIEI